ncbi:hypothetical protein HaLaN_27555 [Haematococcus lacustris]|uniref:Uncharacterized protein n=1 Tax=Haematococcus lacustris TaxID=44745 RepID=A0A6A0A8P4_HAELA|nr:hypothetical protein HaLaN_27555 [Haematococcus lacustris]
MEVAKQHRGTQALAGTYNCLRNHHGNLDAVLISVPNKAHSMLGGNQEPAAAATACDGLLGVLQEDFVLKVRLSEL